MVGSAGSPSASFLATVTSRIMKHFIIFHSIGWNFNCKTLTWWKLHGQSGTSPIFAPAANEKSSCKIFSTTLFKFCQTLTGLCLMRKSKSSRLNVLEPLLVATLAAWTTYRSARLWYQMVFRQAYIWFQIYLLFKDNIPRFGHLYDETRAPWNANAHLCNNPANLWEDHTLEHFSRLHLWQQSTYIYSFSSSLAPSCLSLLSGF